MTAIAGEEASPRYAWYVVAVLMLANVSGFVDRQILVLLVEPIKRDLHISDTQIGSLISAFAISFTLLGLPIARVADSTNRRNVIAAGVAVWSIMTAFAAFASTYPRLLLARIGVGAGESALQPPATSLIADYFPPDRRGSAMGVYSIGIFLGSGLGYFIGGWIVGLVSAQDLWTIPVVGSVHPWQSVFLIIGLPGLLLALIVLTVKEPVRRDRTRGTVPITALLAHIRANLRTFLCLSLGFAASATVNYGIAAWLATFLVRAHGWPASRAGIVQGSLTMTIGVVGVVVGGRVADALVRRGRVDGPLRVGIIGAAGMLVFATAYPFAPNAASAVVWLVLVNFFAAFPWGAASAATAEIMPAAMRAQGAALFLFVLNLVSYTLGPISVAAITDNVFRDPAAVAYSLAIVNVIGMAVAIALFVIGLPAYRRTFAQVHTVASK